MTDNWMLGESAALDDYIPNAPTNILGSAAQGVKDWYMSQPSWLDRAKAENQKTLEAYGRGGMGEIAKQLATDTTEPQELYGAFGVGNIKGVKPPIAPGALAATSEYRPPFYSAVEQAVQGAKQNAAPGQQWAGFLRNQPGVKPEEVEALKLGKLFEQPGSVPKEAVLGEIAANRVNVGEVIKSEQSQRAPATRVNEIDQQLHGIQNEFDQLHGVGGIDERRAALAALERDLRTERAGIVANWQDQASGRTKFSQYTLPGAEPNSYREMLLTLPSKDGGKSARMTQIEQKLQNSGDYDTSELRALRSEYQQLAGTVRQSGEFLSSHYDEPNILAHVRYNDRVIDGKKTLFVEEVQSDWHQAGKRRGYRGTGDATKDLSDADVRAFHDISEGTWMDATAVERSQLRREAGSSESGPGVPDAPFKTTWPELAMKRIIREAAEKGYDKVAWTPGSVQAERYDLSKHLSELHYTSNGHIVGKDHSGKTVIEKYTNDKELPDIVGKDIAEKLITGNGAKKTVWGGLQGKTANSLEGLDLKIGGEGMKGFYDEILPATVNRLVKKHGGRVTQGDLPGETIGGWDVYQGGQLQRTVHTRGEARDARERGFDVRENPVAERGGQKVHTLDITPQLRAQAMKGFPLFTAGGVAATGVMGEMARQDDYRQ